MLNKTSRLSFSFLMILFINVSVTYSQTNLKELLSYPYPSNLCSSPTTGKLAWTFDKEGIRNIFISEDKEVSYKQLTHYTEDDGQEFSNLQFSPDGDWLVYMRGGEPGGNNSQNTPVNPTSSPAGTKFQMWSTRVADNKATVLVTDPGSNFPEISPDSKRVAFIKSGGVWIVPIDGSETARKLFSARGTCSDIQWSPDGEKLAFVSNRGGHSFIGVYSNSNISIEWINPSFSKDVSPRWSPDGNSIAFIRLPASGGAPDSILTQFPHPWEIRTANIQQEKSTLVWKSPNTLRGSVPSTNGKYNLHWAASNRIVFLSTQDNWPHLYSIDAKGGKVLLLTPGNFMTEYIKLSPDKRQVIFSANTGPDKLDIDRRHIGVVSVDKQDMKIRTPGDGIEAFPVYINEKDIAFISSTVFRPALPAVLRTGQKEMQVIGAPLLSSIYAYKNLVRPTQVIFEAPDGTLIHGQLFKKPGGPTKKPAVLSIHGGPMSQMLLGWSYKDYYAAHYAVNQWLADQGFVVLSVNYRLGIGYGNDFLKPPHAGRYGVSEYQDILAAGQWLAGQPDVDMKRIGIYGGSYGGYLTAFALGRNSNLFTAGVDISGPHSRVPTKSYAAGYEHAPDAALADTVAWNSSPIADVDTWTSPVLLIHADDDRNVDFNQSINLLNRLKKKKVYVETLVIPDDTHHWLRFNNLVRVYQATIDFLKSKVMDKK